MVSTTVSILLAGISTHLTTEHEPKGGYHERHNSYGIHIERPHNNWRVGLLGMGFKDSFNKPSGIYAATIRYQLGKDDGFNASLGAGLGYTHTSYYNGIYGAPMVELGYNRLGAQFSYIPKMNKADEVIAAQLKIRVYP